MTFGASPSQTLKNKPDIIVKILYYETGTKSSMKQFSFGIKTYQSANTFNAVQEIVSGNLKID